MSSREAKGLFSVILPIWKFSKFEKSRRVLLGNVAAKAFHRFSPSAFKLELSCSHFGTRQEMPGIEKFRLSAAF